MSKEAIKILMVENDLAHARLAQRAFKRSNLNYEVAHITSAAECLKRLRETKFDVVLLDYYLTGEDGLKILKQIKAQNSSLPVIIVTGRGDEQIAMQAMQLGASDYIVKTINLDHFDLLLIAVQKTLERQRMTGKIYELERQYRSIAENVHDLIYRYTPDYTITYISPSVTKILGYTPDELMYTSYLNILSDHPMNRVCSEAHKKQMQGIELEPFTYEVVKKDGSKVQLETHETVLKTDRGEILGIQGVARDITDRKRLEQQLLHSEKLAVIGKMAAHVAHEVRNPLSSVNLTLDLLANEIKEYPQMDIQEVESLLAAIQSEVEWMGHILDEYLQYARLPKLHLQPGNLNDVVSKLCHFLEPEIAKANVQLHLDLDPNLPQANIDPGQLRLVGINLVRNALEAMPQGGELYISTKHTESQIEFQISDTGMGMDEKQVESIFQPFYSTKPGGTGLGLPYAREIINAHGGYIQCESTLGQNTRFTVVIPVNER